MKTLIVYATKYGCTQDCVSTLKDKLSGEVHAFDTVKGNVPDAKDYDSVIIGGSVYMGQINKKLKGYMEKNKEVLLSKKLGLFVVCGFMDKQQENLGNAFPQVLRSHAASVECFGGEIRKDKMGFLHKKVVAMLEKEVDISKIQLLNENIDRLATAMNN